MFEGCEESITEKDWVGRISSNENLKNRVMDMILDQENRGLTVSLYMWGFPFCRDNVELSSLCQQLKQQEIPCSVKFAESE